jgi:hypothetical protein
MNGDRDRYKACARVLVDLAKARWTAAEDRFGIELQSPNATLRHALSHQEIERGKNLVRSELQPLLNQQFESPSIRKFIAHLEQPAKSSKVKPIGLLIADGREVAQRLEPALRAKGPRRVEALQGAVKPYLQLVVSGGAEGVQRRCDGSCVASLPALPRPKLGFQLRCGQFLVWITGFRRSLQIVPHG